MQEIAEQHVSPTEYLEDKIERFAAIQAQMRELFTRVFKSGIGINTFFVLAAAGLLREGWIGPPVAHAISFGSFIYTATHLLEISGERLLLTEQIGCLVRDVRDKLGLTDFNQLRSVYDYR